MTTSLDSGDERTGVDRTSSQRRERAPRADDAEKRADDAITNLSAYALRLDVEYQRLDDRLFDLLRSDAATAEVRTVVRERDELGAAREAFRRSVAALYDLTRRCPQPALSDQP